MKGFFVASILAGCVGTSSAADVSALKSATSALQGCNAPLAAVGAIKPGMIPSGYRHWIKTRGHPQARAPRNLPALQQFEARVEAAKRGLMACSSSAHDATAKANAALLVAAKDPSRSKADAEVVKAYHDARAHFASLLTDAVKDRRIQSLMSDALKPLMKG